MTVEHKDDTFKIKGKRKEHPNAGKYSGRPSLEFSTAFRSFLSELSYKEQDLFVDGKLIVEEEESAEFFDSIEVNDIVGLGLIQGLNERGENETKQNASYKFLITSIDSEKDLMTARNVTFESLVKKRMPDYKGLDVDLAFEDLSCALGMGFGEILERDGKPYGVSEEIEYTFKIVGPTKEEEEAAAAAAAAGTTPALPADATAKTPEEGDTVVETPYIQNSSGELTAIAVPHAPRSDAADEEEEDEDDEELEPGELSFDELCELPADKLIFAMKETGDPELYGEPCFIITPADTFYGDGCWCDQFQSNDNIDDIVIGVSESVFEPHVKVVKGPPGTDDTYEPEMTMAEVRDELLKRGLVEEPDLLPKL